MFARFSFAWDKMIHDLFWLDLILLIIVGACIYNPSTNTVSSIARIFLGASGLYLQIYTFVGFYKTYELRLLSARGVWRELEIGDREAFIRQALDRGTRDLNCINHPGKVKTFRRLALLFEDDVIAAVTYFGLEENEVEVAAEMRSILRKQYNLFGNQTYSDYYIDGAKVGFIFASGTYFAPMRCPVSDAQVKASALVE